MFKLFHHRPTTFCDGWRRRDFLHAGSLGALGFGLGDLLGLQARGLAPQDVNVIFLMLVGGPSQLDTWDLKPQASSAVRGPYRPIRTNVPGMEISEIFPRMARHADKYAILRTLHHDAPAVHDTGHQLMQTGRLFGPDQTEPHIGCAAGFLHGARRGALAHVLLPRPIGNTGANMPHGQDAAYLGAEHDPFVLHDRDAKDSHSIRSIDRRRNWSAAADRAVADIEERGDDRLNDPRFQAAYSTMTSSAVRRAFDVTGESDDTHRRYGLNRFGQSCLMARNLVRAGVRFVTVNMFETVFEQITWDIHGSRPFSPIEAYSDQVGPMFDNAFSSLLEDLNQTGELDNTLIVASGEFGRTPRINPAGGRDHWTDCWSMLLAGGGVKGAQVIGCSDDSAAAPKERPIQPAEVAATVYAAMGVDLKATLPGPAGEAIPLIDAGVEPIGELFS